MLFVFTLLVVKVFFADLLPHGSGDEFAHIHTVKINKMETEGSKTWTALEDVCHGTNGFVFFVGQIQSFAFVKVNYQLKYKIVFNINNFFKSPDLDPFRKPPKIKSV